MIINRDEMTTGLHADAAADAAVLNAWASTLDEVIHDDKHSGISEDRTRSASTKTK